MYKYVFFIAIILLCACQPKGEKIPKLSFVEEEGKGKEFSWPIDPNQNYHFQLDEEHSISIPANCFVNSKGEIIKTELRFSVKKYDNLIEIISNNLDTRSSQGLLASKGMYYFSAENTAGDKIELNKNNQIRLTVVTDSAASYQLYPRNPSADGVVWGEAEEEQIDTIPFEAFLYWVKEGGYFDDNDDHIYGSEASDSMKKIHYATIHAYYTNDNIRQRAGAIMMSYPYFDRLTSRHLSTFTVLHPDIYKKKTGLGNIGFRSIQEEIEEDLATLEFTFKYLEEATEADLKSLRAFDKFLLHRLEQEIPNIMKLAKASRFKPTIDFYNEYIPRKMNDYRRAFCQEWKYELSSSIVIAEPDPLLLEKLGPELDLELDSVKRKEYQKYFPKLDEIRNSTLPWARPKLSVSINQLGWCNIDKLVGREEQELKVKFKNPRKGVHLAVIFKDEKAVLTDYVEGESFFLKEKMPQTAVVVIGISESKGQLLFAQKEILIGQDKEVELDLQPSSKKEIKAVLDQIEAGY